MINSSVSPSCEFRTITRLPTLTVGNLKIVRSERSYYCYIHMSTYRVVSLLRNLSLGGKLCLRDDKNTAFNKVRHPFTLKASIENVITGSCF